MADLGVLAGPGVEEERCRGMKENTIPAMLGGAPQPNPARLTLDTPHSGAALTHGSASASSFSFGGFF